MISSSPMYFSRMCSSTVRQHVDELGAPLVGVVQHVGGDVDDLALRARCSSSSQTRAFILIRSTTPRKWPSAPIGSWMTAALAPRRSSIESHGGEEVGADAVHLVDEADAGDVVLVGLAPDGLGLGLDAGDGVEHGDGAVEDAQRALDLDGEVDVAGRVDDVDPVVVPVCRWWRRR